MKALKHTESLKHTKTVIWNQNAPCAIVNIFRSKSIQNYLYFVLLFCNQKDKTLTSLVEETSEIEDEEV